MYVLLSKSKQYLPYSEAFSVVFRTWRQTGDKSETRSENSCCLNAFKSASVIVRGQSEQDDII